jgi:hypothetical protein
MGTLPKHLSLVTRRICMGPICIAYSVPTVYVGLTANTVSEIGQLQSRIDGFVVPENLQVSLGLHETKPDGPNENPLP